MALYYRKIYPSIWTNDRVYGLSSLDKLVLNYLLSNEQSNRIGLYVVSVGKAAEETGMEISEFRSRMKVVVDAMGWEYDEKVRMLWIPKWWRYNAPKTSSNLIGNLKDYEGLPNSSLKEKFLANTDDLIPSLRVILVAFAKGEITASDEEECDVDGCHMVRKSGSKRKSTKAPKANHNATLSDSATNGHTNGATIAPTNGPTIGATDGSTNGPTNGQTDAQTIAPTYGQTNGHTDGATYGSTSEAEAEAEEETEEENANATQAPALPSDAAGSADALPPDPAKPGPSACNEDPVVMTFDLRGGGTWDLRESKIRQYEETFPGIDIRRECREAWQWVKDRPKDRKTEKGMPDYLRNWLKKQKNWQEANASRMFKKVDIITSTDQSAEAYDPKTAPVPFNSPEFRRSWVRWHEYSVEIGKLVNGHVIAATAEFAEKWGEQNFINFVQNSVTNRYRSLVPLEGAIPVKQERPKPAGNIDHLLLPWQLPLYGSKSGNLNLLPEDRLKQESTQEGQS